MPSTATAVTVVATAAIAIAVAAVEAGVSAGRNNNSGVLTRGGVGGRSSNSTACRLEIAQLQKISIYGNGGGRSNFSRQMS